MMPDQEVRDAIQKLSERIADVEGDVRVTKHSVANMQMANQGLATKLEKIEERMVNKFDDLGAKVTALNIRQERGFGFFAGIGFVITGCGALLISLAKYLFEGG